jgi:uncharacterized protein YutE (UPF0331/DUF86 family)
MNTNRLPDYLDHMQQAAADACIFVEMRNRIAHGYFDINLEVVWETVQTALPTLLDQLPGVRQAAQDQGEEPQGI